MYPEKIKPKNGETAADFFSRLDVECGKAIRATGDEPCCCTPGTICRNCVCKEKHDFIEMIES